MIDGVISNSESMKFRNVIVVQKEGDSEKHHCLTTLDLPLYSLIPFSFQYQALCESSQQYEPGTQYAEYIRHLPVPQSSSGHSPDSFTFEPYTPDGGK